MVYSRNDLIFDRYHMVNTKSRLAFKVGFPQYSGVGCSLDKCYYSTMTCNFCKYCFNNLYS